MAKIGKQIIEKDIRDRVFGEIFPSTCNYETDFQRINDRQFGCIMHDLNGTPRYVRIGVIVAEDKTEEGISAQEYMQIERKLYEDTQRKNAITALQRAKKAEADKARREAKRKEKEAKEAKEAK